MQSILTGGLYPFRPSAGIWPLWWPPQFSVFKAWDTGTFFILTVLPLAPVSVPNQLAVWRRITWHRTCPHLLGRGGGGCGGGMARTDNDKHVWYPIPFQINSHGVLISVWYQVVIKHLLSRVLRPPMVINSVLSRHDGLELENSSREWASREDSSVLLGNLLWMFYFLKQIVLK